MDFVQFQSDAQYTVIRETGYGLDAMVRDGRSVAGIVNGLPADGKERDNNGVLLLMRRSADEALAAAVRDRNAAAEEMRKLRAAMDAAARVQQEMTSEVFALRDRLARATAAGAETAGALAKTPAPEPGSEGLQAAPVPPPHDAQTGEVRDEAPLPAEYIGPDVPDFDSGEPVEVRAPAGKPERKKMGFAKDREPGQEG